METEEIVVEEPQLDIPPSTEEPAAQPEEREIAAMEDTEAPVAEEWTPNLTYKVKDKELEFDEWARPLVQTKDVEEKLRDIFTKAHGIDEVKQARDTIKEELGKVKPEYEQLTQSLGKLDLMVQNGDYKSFFDTLKIPKEDILRYAIQELKYQEMPAEQKAEIDNQRQAQQRLYDLEEQNKTLSGDYQEVVRTQMTMSLESELARPETAAAVQEYDARVGQPGAFRQEVINRGAFYEQTYGKTRTAGEIVQELVNIVGGVQSQATTPPLSGAGQTPVVKPTQKQTLPNVQGATGSSPSKRRPKSINDLKELRKQMLSQG